MAGQELFTRLMVCASSRPGSQHITQQGIVSTLIFWNTFKNSPSCSANFTPVCSIEQSGLILITATLGKGWGRHKASAFTG